MTRWLTTYACDPTRCLVPIGWRLQLGVPVLVGREGDVALGVEMEDEGVSRRAAVITATPDGWDVQVDNRSGAVLHPWAQAPILARRHEAVSWPRVGLRVRGSSEALQHWVLLETDAVDLPPSGPTSRTGPTTRTARSRASDPLTASQVTALETVFAAQLRWPPAQPAVVLQLKQAARRLGLSESGVQDRLTKARARALQLGLHRPVALTDPEYLFFLVRAGLLPAPPRLPHRVEPCASTGQAAAQQSSAESAFPV